jgi:hypothetical protein
MSTETNMQNLTPDVVARVDALADGSALRQPKDGTGLSHREQAANRKPAKGRPAKSPMAEKPEAEATKLTLTENRAMKRVMVAAMRAVNFSALSRGDGAYPELAGVQPALMRAEVERHCRYLDPKAK